MIKLKYTLVLASILLFASCNEQNKQIAYLMYNWLEEKKLN